MEDKYKNDEFQSMRHEGLISTGASGESANPSVRTTGVTFYTKCADRSNTCSAVKKCNACGEKNLEQHWKYCPNCGRMFIIYVPFVV